MTETEPAKPNLDKFINNKNNFNDGNLIQSIPSQNFNIPEEFKIDKNKLVLHEIVGQGGYSVVVKGEYRGADIVVKIISNKGQQFQNSFIRECEILKQLKNNNIVLLMGMYIDTQNEFQYKFLRTKPGDYLQCIMSEYCEGGNLYTLIHETEIKLSVLQKLKIITGIVKAMIQIHSNDPPILHRDLKSLNILLSQRVDNASSFVAVKVTDFGISKEIDTSNSSKQQTSCVGSQHWMAPEVVKEKSTQDEKADVWSFGVILHEIIFSEIPYADIDQVELKNKIVDGKYKINRNDMKDDFDKKLQMLMHRCIDQDSNKRQSFQQIQDNVNQICKNMNIRL